MLGLRVGLTLFLVYSTALAGTPDSACNQEFVQKFQERYKKLAEVKCASTEGCKSKSGEIPKLQCDGFWKRLKNAVISRGKDEAIDKGMERAAAPALRTAAGERMVTSSIGAFFAAWANPAGLYLLGEEALSLAGAPLLRSGGCGDNFDANVLTDPSSCEPNVRSCDNPVAHQVALKGNEFFQQAMRASKSSSKGRDGQLCRYYRDLYDEMGAQGKDLVASSKSPSPADYGAFDGSAESVAPASQGNGMQGGDGDR